MTSCDESNWPDPTEEMMNSPEFNAIWDLIKEWDVNVPGIDEEGSYSMATGNHARAIIDAIKESRPDSMKSLVKKLKFKDLGRNAREFIIDKLDEMMKDTVL